MSITNKKIAVFDASPVNDPTPWMRRACESAGVFLADINAVAEVFARKDHACQKLLERGPRGPASELAEHYLEALEELSEGKPRVAVHSVVWIDYGVVPRAAVLDFDPLESERTRAVAAGIGHEEATRAVSSVRERMEQHVRDLDLERRLVLPAGASDYAKAELAARHLSDHLS